MVRSRRRLGLMLANQQRENSRQQHENQRLDQTYQQLQKIKWNRYQPAEARDKPGHGFQHVLTCKNVAVETKTQGDRTEQNGDDLQTTDYEEDHHQEHLQ